jgi:DNA polymerase-1
MKKKIRNFKIKRFRCKALVGDPSDNIPGIFGIGEKTAIEILLKFGSLEKLYEKIEEKKIDQKIKETLLKYKGQALLVKI